MSPIYRKPGKPLINQGREQELVKNTTLQPYVSKKVTFGSILLSAETASAIKAQAMEGMKHFRAAAVKKWF